MKDKTIKAFSPGHITGLFSIPPRGNNAASTGSTGAGISLDKGVTTSISPLSGTDKDIISINGKRQSTAEVSLQVLNLFRQKKLLNFPLEINHQIDLPLGSGFGTSGAGALSLAVALNRLLENPLSKIEAAALAHEAEILCATGLGTVIGEFYGNAEIRISPGAPGFGKVNFLTIPRDTEIIFWILGPYPTKEILRKKQTAQLINKAGLGLLGQLQESPDLATFMHLSREFAEKTGLISTGLQKVLQLLDAEAIPCSMLMFGEALFTAGPKSQIEQAARIFTEIGQGSILRCGIDKEGVRIL